MKRSLSKVHPLFLILIATLTGVFFADLLEFSWEISSYFVYVCFFGAIVFILVFYLSIKRTASIQNNYLWGGSFCLLMIFLSFLNATFFHERNHEQHFSSHFSSCHKIQLTESIEEKKKSYKVEVLVKGGCDSNRKEYACKGNAIVYLKKDAFFANLEMGDELWVKVHFKEVSNGNFSAFNYEKFLFRKQIYYQAYLSPDKVMKVEKAKFNSFLRYSQKIRASLLEKIGKCGLVGDSKGLASALLLGQMKSLDEELKGAYRSAGVVHILCVSGLHLGVFVWCIMQVLFFLKQKRSLIGLKILILLLCIWGYAFVTGLSPSVLRAATMFSFVFVGQCFDREIKIGHSLVTSALVLLWFSPAMLFSIGFQLSYLAILGIVYIQPLFDKLYKPKSRCLYYFWSLLTVSLSAQLLTFPLVIYYFGQFPTYFLFSNLVASPIAAILIPLGFAFLSLSFVSLFLAKGLAFLFSFLVEILNQSVLFIQELPHSVLDISSVSGWGSLCIYLFIACVFLSLIRRQKHYVYSSLISLWLLILVI